MNTLPTAKRVAVVAALCEGMSIRATVRVTGVAKNTIVKLLMDMGDACSKYQDGTIRGIRSKRVQCDEIWSFVGSKEKNTSIEKKAHGWGDCWTWTALDADTKLMISFRLGDRSAATAYDFMHDVAERLANRIQLTTDGYKVYIEAVESAFNLDVDYAMLNKVYRANQEGESRYSPAKCVGCDTKVISGNPNPKHVSTSYAERANLSMRMSMRRFTRLTNAFSKKLENHAVMVALYFMYYNFARIHQTLRVTPAIDLNSKSPVATATEGYAMQETSTSPTSILQFRQDIEAQFRRHIREALDVALAEELAAALGSDRHQRTDRRCGYRHGTVDRNHHDAGRDTHRHRPARPCRRPGRRDDGVPQPAVAPICPTDPRDR